MLERQTIYCNIVAWISPAGDHESLQRSYKCDHLGEDARFNRSELRSDDLDHVILVELLHPHLCEAIQKRLRKPLSTSTLLQWVLAAEDSKSSSASERDAQLGDENRASMVKTRVQPLQNRLWGEIELIQDDPVPTAHSGEERPILCQEPQAVTNEVTSML